MKYRIKIEQLCRDCNGTGTYENHLCPIPDFECPGEGKCGEVQTVPCPDCEGTRYVEVYTSLQGLLDLIEENKK